MKLKQNPLIKKMANRIAQKLGIKTAALYAYGWEQQDVIDMHGELFGRRE